MLHYYKAIIIKLRPAKFVNLFLLYSGYLLSRLFRKPVILGMPVSVSIEPTTSCNLRCPQCPSGLRSFSRPTGMLSSAGFRNVLHQIKNSAHSLTFYFQGEPFLNPSFLEMVKEASDEGLYTITSTNGHYLTAAVAEQTVLSSLDKLIISIDGVTDDVYSTYRKGGSLEKVISGTQLLLSERKRLKRKNPHVVWQFVAFSHNLHQVEEVKRLGKKLGVDRVMIKTAQLYDFENGGGMMATEDKYSRYAVKDGKYVIKNQLLNHCWRMWKGCVITWDGKVVPCCFDKDASHKVGDLSSESFKEVWNSAPYNDFRQAILNGRDQIDICTNCTEGTKVWA